MSKEVKKKPEAGEVKTTLETMEAAKQIRDSEKSTLPDEDDFLKVEKPIEDAPPEIEFLPGHLKDKVTDSLAMIEDNENAYEEKVFTERFEILKWDEPCNLVLAFCGLVKVPEIREKSTFDKTDEPFIKFVDREGRGYLSNIYTDFKDLLNMDLGTPVRVIYIGQKELKGGKKFKQFRISVFQKKA